MSELEQEIARLEDQLQKVKQKKLEKDNGTKFVIGGMMMTIARRDPETAKKLVHYFDSELNRCQDKARVLDFNNELRKLLDMPELILEKPPRTKKKDKDEIKNQEGDENNNQ